MSNQVAIIGGSMTKFGERDAWVRELLAEAGEACLDDAGVTPTTWNTCTYRTWQAVSSRDRRAS